MIEQTWQALPAQEQTILQQLSIFPHSFSQSAAEAVAGATLPILQALPSQNLVEALPDGRFVVVEEARPFLEGELGKMPALWASTRYRLAQHFTQLLQSKESHLKFGADQAVASQTLAQELDNIRLAWMVAVEQQADDLLKPALQPLYLLLKYQQQYQDGAKLFGQLVTDWQGDLTPEQQRVLGLATCIQANMLFHLGREAGAKRLAEQGLTQLQPVSMPADWANAGMLTLRTDLTTEDMTVARLFADSRAIFQALDDKWGLATVLHEMSVHFYAIAPDKHPQAQELATQSLTIRQEIGDQWGESQTLRHLAEIAKG